MESLRLRRHAGRVATSAVAYPLVRLWLGFAFAFAIWQRHPLRTRTRPPSWPVRKPEVSGARWFRRAVIIRHRHAIEQVSRLGVEVDAAIQDERALNLSSTQVVAALQRWRLLSPEQHQRHHRTQVHFASSPDTRTRIVNWVYGTCLRRLWAFARVSREEERPLRPGVWSYLPDFFLASTPASFDIPTGDKIVMVLMKFFTELKTLS